MKRKVIKQANQAYTITLPINWVRENNIDKHPEIDIDIHEKSLTISNKENIKHTTANVDVTSFDKRAVYRIINALYAKGIDEIKLTGDQCTSTISQVLSNTIGYALISKEDNKFIIKDLGGTSSQDLDEIFKRTFQMILSFYSSAIKEIFEERNETMHGLKARDSEINKFSHFLQRAINKMSYTNQIKGRILFTYSFELEKMGDEIERLWRTDLKYKIKTSSEIKKLAQDSMKIVEKVFDSYFTKQTNNHEEIYQKRDKLRKDSMKIKTNTITMRAIRHIVKVAEEAVDLIHLNLMMKL
jgi:phosphate uptake regulator